MKKLLILLIISIFTLFGCASSSESEVVEIEFMHSMVEDERQAAIQVILDDFNATHEGIVVTQVPVAEDQYNSKIVTLGSAGELPAVMHVGKDMVGTLLENEYINTSVTNEIVMANESDYYQGVLNQSMSEDGTEYVMVPNEAWVQGVWYDKAAFEAAGLEAPTNWANITAAAEYFQANGTQYGMVVPTDESTFTQQVFSQFALSNGANVLNENGEVTFDTPEMKEAAAYYQELAAYGPEGSVDINTTKDAYLNGSTNMIVYSNYLISSAQEVGKLDTLGFAPFSKTSGDEVVSFGNVSGYVVSSNLTDEETAAAKTFVEYLATPEVMVQWNLMAPGGSLPVSKTVTASEEYTSNEVVAAMGDLTQELAAGLETISSFGTVGSKNFNSMGPITNSNLISSSINQVIVHDANIDEVFATTQTEMEGIVE